MPPDGTATGVGLTRPASPASELLALFQRPAWWADALCREPGYGSVNFYPEQGESAAEAKAICAGCLVREECAAFARANADRFGIWGGLNARERGRGQPRTREPPPHGTTGRYRKGCKCEPCRAAQQLARAKYRRRAA